MGELRGFMRIGRAPIPERDALERVARLPRVHAHAAARRAARAGRALHGLRRAFCHSGCPLGNLIPDWNDLVYRDRWQDAIRQLHFTNNFPEFTGRLCPAPCEAACVLEINEGNAVTIKQIENAIINRAFDEGWVVPVPPAFETGRRVAIVGSGPAGLAAAQQLRRAGHAVVVFERDEAAGGLVRFGVPDFKIEKWVVERRVGAAPRRGRRAAPGRRGRRRCRRRSVALGVRRDRPRDRLARAARPAGRGPRASRHALRDGVPLRAQPLGRRRARAATAARRRRAVNPISAAGRDVVVIGGGDTGADCVGQAIREGARSVLQLELVPEPPPSRPDDRTPWPRWPNKMRLSYAMKEVQAAGRGELDFSVVTTRITGEGRVAGAARRARAGGAAVRSDRGHRARDPGRPRAARDGLRAP